METVWTNYLSSEDLNFIRMFVINSGSLKKLSLEYEVSYPTIRERLDRLIKKIELNDSHPNCFKNKIMQLVIDKQINFEVANKIIELYEKEGERNNE